MRAWFIYTLNEPLTDEVRYVGKTVDPSTRMRNHTSHARKYKFYAAQWIASLLDAGTKPTMHVVDSGFGSGAAEAEIRWIEHYRSIGAKLTNTAPGGAGSPPGGRVSDETKRKISESNRGRVLSAETRARIAASKRGVKQSAETIAKRSLALTGHPCTAECRAKISQANSGHIMTAEMRALMSKNRSGIFPSEATKVKLRVAQRARRAREAAQREGASS